MRIAEDSAIRFFYIPIRSSAGDVGASCWQLDRDFELRVGKGNRFLGMRRLPAFSVGEWQVRSWISDRAALLLERLIGAVTTRPAPVADSDSGRALAERLLESPCILAWVVARMSATGATVTWDISRLVDWLEKQGLRRLLDDARSSPPEWRTLAAPPPVVMQAIAAARRCSSTSTSFDEPETPAVRQWGKLATLFACGAPALVVTDARGDIIEWEKCGVEWLPDCPLEILRRGSEQMRVREADVEGEFPPVSETGSRESVGELTEFATGFESRLFRWAQLSLIEQDFARELERAKLSAMKELAYGASHEINNPLANISTRAQTLLRDETHPERRQKLAMINAQAFRAHEMISNMMLFAHPPDLQRELVSWQAVLDQVQAELQRDADLQQTTLLISPSRFETDAAVAELHADPTHLAVLLKALVRNSLEAIGLGGQVELRCRFDNDVPVAGCDRSVRGVRLEVIDDGPGIPQHVREHLFDPFYSGREAGRGLGFGLSKAWRIVDLHGGCLSVVGLGQDRDDTSSPPFPESRTESRGESVEVTKKGAVFVVQLPLPCDGSSPS